MNFVTLIGWSPGEGSEQEIFTREQLINQFTLDKLTESSGVFDEDKLEWMNGLYIRNLSDAEFVDRAMPYLEKADIGISRECFAAIAPHVKERVKTLVEIAPMVDFLGTKPVVRQMDAMFQKGIDAPKAREVLTKSIEVIKGLPEFTVAAVEHGLRGVAEGLGLKVGPAFVVLRIAVTGKTVTPPLFESFAVLGKDTVLSRLEETLALLGK